MNIPINDAMVNASGSQEKLSSLEIDLGNFVRARIRELSIIDKVLPPVMVTHADVQRETNSQSFSMIVDIEPDSEAAVVNLGGSRRARFVNGKRVRIPFYKVDTDEQEIKVEELPAYTYPVTKVIEDNQVRDLQRAKDEDSFRTADSILTGTGQIVTAASGAGLLDKDKLRNLKNIIDTKNLATDRIIMNIADFNDLAALKSDELGRDLASQVFVDGFTYTTIMGMKVVVTTETKVVPVGSVYAFTSPDFLGKQFVLSDTHFSIEKRHDLLTWKMWQVLGVGFVNTKAIARLDIVDSKARGL